MAELELQQVKCPSCKRVISSFNPFQTEVECPYCHNKAFNPLITAKKVPIPERIVLFYKTEKDFENEMVSYLVETDYVPIDIFEKIGTDKVYKAYLPMYLFEGLIDDTSYSYEIEEENADYKKVWNTYTGRCRKNFSYMSLAYEGDEIPEQLVSFARYISYDATSSREYNPELLGNNGINDDIITLAINTDREIIWKQFAENYLYDEIKETIIQNLPAGYRNYEVSNLVYNLREKGRYILAPFWFVYYTYGNEQYYFIMDGTGKKQTMSFPQSKEEKKYVDKMENWSVVGSILWFAFSIVMSFVIHTGFWLGILFICIPAVGIFWYLDRKAKSRLSSSKAARAEGARRIMGK